MAQLENSYAADVDDDDDEEDFLEVLGGGSSGDGRGGWGIKTGGDSIAKRGRKFLKRISTRSGSNGERCSWVRGAGGGGGVMVVVVFCLPAPRLEGWMRRRRLESGADCLWCGAGV